MARKHNKRANKRSQSVDIKAYAQQLEGVFRKYPARKFNYKQLASQLGYKPEMVKAKIEMALSDMERSGTILMVDRFKYKLKYTSTLTEGVVDMASNGNAYVVSPDTESDIMVRSPNLKHALHGDRVRVSLFARRGGKRLEGEIVEIVERKQTASANAMVWSNLKQFSLNLSQSTVYFNYDREVPVMVLDPDTGKKYKFGSYMDKGSIMMVQSVSAGYMKMFSTHIVTAGISNVYLGQKENNWKGFVGGFALTSMGVFLEGGEKIATVSITGFATKPFNVKDRLVVSPMLAYSHSPMTYAVKAKTITWTEYGTYIVGSNFDFKLSQRFNANIGGTVIGNTQPGIPMSYAITVGSRFQF